MIFFRLYDAQYGELLSFLVENWEMKKPYAEAFLGTYKRNIGRMVISGKKKAKQLREEAQFGHLLALDFEDPNVVVVCQAYIAYMTDLRRGKFVGSMVEKTIWAILANRSDLLRNFDRGLAEYVNDEHEKKFPRLFEEVFIDIEVSD